MKPLEKRTTRLLSWAAVVAVLLAAGVVAVWPRDDYSTPATRVPPSPAPDLTVTRAKAALRPCPRPGGESTGPAALAGIKVTCLGDGATVDLARTLAGRATLINIWASWCQPCREELPVLERYSSSPGAMQVLGVQVQSDPADGLNLLADLGVRFPSVVDSDGAVSRALRAPQYLPVSYVVRPDGEIHRIDPPTPFSHPDQVRATLERYLS